MSDLESIDGNVAFAATARGLIDAAVREVDLMSYALEARVYADSAFYESLKTLALSSDRATVRLLVNQPRSALRNAPQLIDLARRLSSRISMRELDREDLDQRGEWLIVDRRSLLVRRGPEQTEAEVLRDNPLSARDSVEHFQRLWDRASPSAELRDLGL